MKTTRLWSCAALTLVTGMLACGGGRPPDVYQADITKLIGSTNDKVKTCYEEALKENPSIEGTLTILFWAVPEGKIRAHLDRNVEMKFGNLGVVKNKTTVPLSLGKCVIDVIEKLDMAPPDPKRAEVAWTWKFTKNQSPTGGPTAPAAVAPTQP